jgi:hypothetical protein
MKLEVILALAVCASIEWAHDENAIVEGKLMIRGVRHVALAHPDISADFCRELWQWERLLLEQPNAAREAALQVLADLKAHGYIPA